MGGWVLGRAGEIELGETSRCFDDPQFPGLFKPNSQQLTANTSHCSRQFIQRRLGETHGR